MFTILGADGKEYGPVPAATVRKWIADVRADARTQVRREGETGWRSLGELPEFADAFATAVPPPLGAPASETAGPAEPEATAPLAGRGLRFLAALIDGLVETLCWIPTSMVVANTVLAGIENRTLTPQLIVEAFTDSLPRSLPLLIPFVLVQAALLTFRGQSIGKLLCRLRIVRYHDDGPAGFMRAFLIRGVATWLFSQLPLFGRIFWLIDIGFIFRDDHRCLHDLMAGTHVVRA
jgi:uncharacterized RDD family membrane protein YckC